MQRAEQAAQLDELAVGARQLRAERAELLADVASALTCDLADPPFEPPALGLDRERPGVPLGEGVLDARKQGRIRIEKLFDLPLHSEDVPVHGSGVRLSAWPRRGDMGQAAHLPASLDPPRKGQGYTGAVRARLAVVALLAALAPSAAAAASLPSALASALRVPHVSLAATGAVVLDLDTGATIYSRNATLSLLPASNEKLAVTYAALTALGPAFTIETDVLGEGQQTGATWQGDLVLKGYGDPSLSTADLTALARQVRANGITRVTGSVLGDESWFDSGRTAPGWKAAFYINESPPLSALIVDRGRYGRYTSHDPALAAAELFRSALVHAGVHVGGTARHGTADDGAVPIGAVDSPPLSLIVHWMDRVSDNFTAEMLVKELGAVQAGHGTTAAGVGVVTGLLAQAGVPLAGVRIVDGSGLSLLDRETPAALASLLTAMWNDVEVRLELLSSLPVAGRTGTLADRMRRSAAAGVVRAKTGTTDNASALSGFAGDRYVFSILQNGWPISWSWARLAQDRFATLLAAAQ
jgi:serine-type D-Ala-D-Ala carboxypeptidase/endopeptidase (penicillin-binding protein 4)